MTRTNSLLIMLVLVVGIILAGCTKTNTESEITHTEPLATNTSTNTPSDANSNTNQSDVTGSVKVDNSGSETNVTYTFKNQSDKVVTVVGGARYKLLKDNQVADEGRVPIKDYIDLESGQEYTDSKTFLNLEPGSYTVLIEWNKTIVSSEFVLI
ncbi:hypothetical protein [Paenibacillus sp. FSL M7-0896]